MLVMVWIEEDTVQQRVLVVEHAYAIQAVHPGLIRLRFQRYLHGLHHRTQ